MHAGHLAYFKSAKAFGDHLTVSITSDRFVNKGPGRPYFPLHLRMEMIKALGIVDEVVVSDHPSAVAVIGSVKPDVYAKGPDYKDLTKDVTGEIYNEKKAVEAHGGRIVFTDEQQFSSTRLINGCLADRTDAQKEGIEKAQASGGLVASTAAIESLAGLRVLVVGEPILDVYRFVHPEGISSKSPSISARFKYEERYHGGSLAIVNHLKGFCRTVMDQHHMKVAEKVRYIAGNQRIFEVTNIEDNWWASHDPTFFCDKVLELAEKADVVIIADFGHGLFEGPVLDALSQIGPKTFVGLNAQANSSNFGFNVYTKHKRFDYLCLDTREARLAEHDRYSAPEVLAHRIADKIKPASLGMTFGPNGAALITPERAMFSAAYSDAVIDATGAGDAFFALSTLLLATGCEGPLIPFIANVFAGLKTQIIGNKASVSKASLLKAIAGLLG